MVQVSERLKPVAGIGYGQSGFWGNEHFSTMELAQEVFEKKLVELRRIYGTAGRGWTGKYIEEDRDVETMVGVIRNVIFVPLKKDGKRGQRIHILRMYHITKKESEQYLSDPFYSVYA